jgi:ATP-dependent helicase/nuclease subunit B
VGIVTIPLDGNALPAAVARLLLDRHADHLPDLSGLTVLVPSHRAGQDFARELARAANRPVLIPPRILPLKSWAASVAPRAAAPQAQRLAQLHGVLRRTDWLGKIDKWALADELLGLADELSAARLGGDIASQIRALRADALSRDALSRETALIEAVWQALNSQGHDPQAVYAAALDALVAQQAQAPQPIYAYAPGPLTAVEQLFLQRCADHAPVTLFTLATDTGQALPHTLHQAWAATEPPLRDRAATLASAYPESPLLATMRLCPAPHLEAEARAVAAWVAEQLHAGRRAIALIALDRESARRVRALLERLDVLVADETGWTLSTTAAAAVVDRWLECVASDFPHVELLDLLKSPFLLGELAARQDQVLQLELALRRHGVAQGMADIGRLAFAEFGGATPDWLSALLKAKQQFAQTRAPLAVWLGRLIDSLGQLDATLAFDAAGGEVMRTLDTLRRELAADAEKYGFGEWRRWLNLALESATFTDTRVASPIVLTSLPNARGRVFEAVALIGADARHLPAAPTPGLFSQTTRAQLGLPTAADAAAALADDLIPLLAQGASLISWQAWHDDEPNPASPLVLRLQALHQAAWGTALPQQIGGAPPARPGPPLAAGVQPAPRVAAAHLPRRYSASSYQTLLDCPYRFFVKSVLRIDELLEADADLDKSDYGNTLHRILKHFHDSAPPPEHAAALSRLDEISAAEFAALPAYPATVWRSQWQKIQPAYIDAWLAWQAEGWRYQSGETNFSVTHAVAGLGDVTLHGRIDRVDVRLDPVGEETPAVIDYKTSAASGLKKKLKDPAEAVQLPFYAWLADAAAAYLPINETPITPLALEGETDVDAISRRLPELLAAIAAGARLPASGVENVCGYCEARGLCRKGMWDTMP